MSGPRAITPAGAFAALRDRRAEWVLLDVREKGQASLGQPFGAVNLPYSRLEVLAPEMLPRRAVSIALFDEGDGVAGLAARRLAALGYHDLAVVSGGRPAWQAAGLALFEGVHVVPKAFGEWVERRFAIPSITPDALAGAATAGRAPLLLDVRPEAEHRRFTLPDSRSCPNGELAARLDSLRGLGPLAVHCAGRTRSLIGAQTLRDLDPGLDVVAVRDGTQGWELAGHAREMAPDRPAIEAADPAAARAAAAALIHRFALPVIDAETAARLSTDPHRTTYLLDPRCPAEAAAAPAPAAFRVAPATTLVQQTDRFLAVHGARVLLWDPILARAAFAAHWLRRMGVDALVVDGPPPDPAPPAAAPLATLPMLDPEAVAGGRAAGCVLLDLRPSAEHAAARPEGALWSIRPRVALDAAGAPVLLLGESGIAAMAAIDLAEAGTPVIGRLTGDAAEWEAAGIAVVRGGDAPPGAIDRELFCAGRHAGDLDDARRYLAWEHALLDRIEAAGIDPGWRAEPARG